MENLLEHVKLAKIFLEDNDNASDPILGVSFIRKLVECAEKTSEAMLYLDSFVECDMYKEQECNFCHERDTPHTDYLKLIEAIEILKSIGN